MRINQRSAVVIKRGEKLLLIKRKKDNKTYYILPGGGVESDETPEEAAIREVKEELGIDIKIKEKLAEFEHRGGREFYYLSDSYSGEIQAIGDGVFNKNIKDEPLWIARYSLKNIDLLPEKIKGILIRFFDKNK